MQKYFTGIIFLVLIFGFMLANIFAPDNKLSLSERRELAQFPSIDASFFEDLNTYANEQFVLRDSFRRLSVMTRLYALFQSDVNRLYVTGGSVAKMYYPLNEDSVKNAAKLFNAVKRKYFTDAKTYISVIPDKSAFSSDARPRLDTDKMIKILRESTPGMEYIDIFSKLRLEDYYNTDSHWRQEKIGAVVSALENAMGFSAEREFTRREKENFYGVFYGQAALPLKPDTLVWLNSEITERSGIYNTELLNGKDSYDVFASGATPVISFENELGREKKPLVIFRDSFASSLAPLILSGFSKITLVDLRYINSEILDEYVNFKDADVLFLYSAPILNDSYIMR